MTPVLPTKVRDDRATQGSFFCVCVCSDLTSMICSSCQIFRSLMGRCVGLGQAFQTQQDAAKGSSSFCLRITETSIDETNITPPCFSKQGMSRQLSRCVSIGADLVGVRNVFCDSCDRIPERQAHGHVRVMELLLLCLRVADYCRPDPVGFTKSR
jgi:hypothetical protein